MPSVTIENVSRRFGAVTAVNNISLDIPDGSFVSLLGPSGCGKTTTLRMIAGLEQNNTGRIAIGDRIVSDADRGQFIPPEWRNAGMVFQSYAIWPHMTVFDNVAYPLRVRKMKSDIVRDKTMAALRTIEMEAYASRPATALSGGQQQRVAIARAIAFAPSVLLLDEPLSNLDAKLREQMRLELRGLQKQLGITSVYVTHDQEEAMAMSDFIVVMRDGNILQIGDPETVYFRPANARVAAFCGSPNMLDATVSQSVTEGSRHFVNVEGRNWGGWGEAAGPIPVGAPVAAVIRPEALKIVEGSQADRAIQLSGTVEQNIFRGFRRTLIVRVGDEPLTLDIEANRSVEPGSTVALSIDADRTWILPGAVEAVANAA